MNKFIPTLCFFAFLLFSAFTTDDNPHEALPTEPITCVDASFEKEIILAANCCGTINIPQPICGGTITFIFTLQPVGGGTVTNLNVGNNYVEVDKGGKYILSYTAFDTGAPSPCLPIQASWNLCGSPGSAILNPSTTVKAGKANIPCFM